MSNTEFTISVLLISVIYLLYEVKIKNTDLEKKLLNLKL